MTAAISWVAKTAGLVFSLLITLSLIGSLAAITTGGDGPDPVPRTGVPEPTIAAAPSPRAMEAVPRRARLVSLDAGIEATPVPAARPRDDDPLRWLEPLTYALVALAGLMTVAVALLWRIAERLAAR